MISAKTPVLVTGIASPELLVDKLSTRLQPLYKILPDHHAFTKEDIRSIQQMIDSVDDPNKIILYDQKDAVCFRALAYLDDSMKRMLYYIPVQVSFGQRGENHSTIKHLCYVKNYSTNRRLPIEQN